jgi:hypothetical protein
MSHGLDILHLLGSEQPFAMLARAVRYTLGAQTPNIYDRLRFAMRAEMEDLVRAAIAHYRALSPETRDAIAVQMKLYAQAQSLANSIDNPPVWRSVLPHDGAVFPTPELQALLN